jgi:hypothetical protein
VRAIKKTGALKAVVDFSEHTKEVVWLAFNIRLLGLNARVLATRIGERAQGFGVLSGEWTSLGDQLRTQMEQLNRGRDALVRTASRRLIDGHRAQLVDRALALSGERGRAVATDRRGRPVAVSDLRHELEAVLAAAGSLCTFGLVISRSAKIEAAWAKDSAALLNDLAVDFERSIESVLPALKRLNKLAVEAA